MNFANLTTPGVIPAVAERFRVKGMRRKNLGTRYEGLGTVYGAAFAVRCVLEVQHHAASDICGERDVLMIVEGGVTGFESMVLDERCLETLGTTSWCANAGGMGWDELRIDTENMRALRKWVDTRLSKPSARDLLRSVMRKIRTESGNDDPMFPFSFDAEWEALAIKIDEELK